MMRNPLLLLPAVVLVGYAALAGGQAATKSSGEVPAHIKTIYKADCALCHGDSGDGKTDLAKDMALTLSDFTDPKTLQSITDEQIFQLIRKGKDKMPPEEEGRAKDADVHSLILYIRNFSKGRVSPSQASPTVAPAAAPADAPAAAPATAPSN